MKLVVDLLLDAQQYNGHFQTELTRAAAEDLFEIVTELNTRFDGKQSYLEFDDEGGGAIYIKDYWQSNENGHHIDRLVLSVNEIYWRKS